MDNCKEESGNWPPVRLAWSSDASHPLDMNVREERDLAWIGDAVLALYAREWLLEQPDHPLFSRQERFIRLTSNNFLKALGEPTKVEASIGIVYQKDGLNAAFQFIEEHLQPLFQKHLTNATKGHRGKKR